MMEEQEIRLTQFSRGAGCGCKIAPAALEEILKTSLTLPDNDKLLVGNDSRDDAAVYDLGNGMALVATTDFFMPIVDDARDFGRIAAANAISDVYAMGGKPLLAIAILGWPVDKIPLEYAQKMLEGGREVCAEAGIKMAGGHSIDSPEPIFGLAVNGIVPVAQMKRNNTAHDGDWLFLTKPLGVGIYSTAQKRGVLKPGDGQLMVEQMSTLNKVGEALGKVEGVHAMTDVTGFGLLGHVIEIAQGSDLSAEIYYSKLPVLPGVKDYLAERVMPDATYRNWNSYSAQTSFETGVDVMQAFSLLPDPQTNGGLLIAVSDTAVAEVREIFRQNGLNAHLEAIGRLTESTGKTIVVKN